MSKPNIASEDIDLSKISIENFHILKEKFPRLPDEMLCRYLIARNDDVEKATEQLEKAQKTRLENWPVMKSSCINEMRTGKLYVHGTDREGRPLVIWRAAANVPRTRDLEETSRLLIFFTEYTLKKLMPKNKSKYTVLIDRSGFTSENSDMELMRHTASTFQDLFPESMYKCVIYPSDWLYWTIWNVAKWFLDPVTRNKVHPVMTFAGVEEFIERKYIPKTMGGDCEYEFNEAHYEDHYTPEELATFHESKKLSGGKTADIFKDSDPQAPITESDKFAKDAAEEELEKQHIH